MKSRFPPIASDPNAGAIPFHVGDARCAKRNWVMAELTENDGPASLGALPPGVRFHLSRCPSCRELADRITHVSHALAAWAATDTDDEMLAKAVRRTKGALRDGARLTGRVKLDDEFETDSSEEFPVRRWAPSLRLGRLVALAATIVMAASVWLFRASTSEEGRPLSAGAPNQSGPRDIMTSTDPIGIASMVPTDSEELVSVPDESEPRPVRICPPSSLEDRAFLAGRDCIPTGFVLPARHRPDPRTIDSSPATLSTTDSSRR